MAYCATNGNLYENGKAFELKVSSCRKTDSEWCRGSAYDG